MANPKSKAKSKNRVGRPTKFTPELVKKAQHYLENFEEYNDAIPSVVGLALVVDVRRETLHVWAKEDGKEELSNILSQIQEKQERVLINSGLDGTFNSNITKLVLGKHGYHDKQETELSGKDGGAIETKWTVEIIDAKTPNPKSD